MEVASQCEFRKRHHSMISIWLDFCCCYTTIILAVNYYVLWVILYVPVSTVSKWSKQRTSIHKWRFKVMGNGLWILISYFHLSKVHHMDNTEKWNLLWNISLTSSIRTNNYLPDSDNECQWYWHLESITHCMLSVVMLATAQSGWPIYPCTLVMGLGINS